MRWAPTHHTGAQRRGVAVLVANSGLMSAGFFMLIPLLSVHLTRDLGLSGAAAGAVLAVRQLAQQGLMLFGGALADRVGYRPVIALGMLVRALGFCGFGLGDSLPVILLSAIVAALGGALFEATSKAALASLTLPADRPRLFSISAVAGGAGSALGPLIGVALLPYSFRWVGLAAGGFFFAAFALSAILLPPLAGAGITGTTGATGTRGPATAAGKETSSLGRTLRVAASDLPFLTYTALLSGFWLLFNQLYISLPLRATQVTGAADIVGLLYTVAALAGLGLQYPVVRLASWWLTPAAGIAVGVAAMGGGLGLMAFAGDPATAVPVMLAAVVIFAAGRALAEPMRDVTTAALAPPHALAAYFGISYLALAVGGSAGNYLGGWLFDLSSATGLHALPWILFAVFGATVAAGLLWFSRGHPPGAGRGSLRTALAASAAAG
jgi:DHA1 family multidrug resistance protein-like MFS transporter